MAAGGEGVFLTGQEALNLWLKGKDVWNEWVKENPVAGVGFSHVEFFKYRNTPTIAERSWPFAGFIFPTGHIEFIGALFGNGDVSFVDTSFGEGDIYFDLASFGTGDVYFNRAKFGDGAVSFEGVSFGKGIISFDSVSFGNGNVTFDNALFDEGDVFIGGASVGVGTVSFDSASFGKGNVFFDDTLFGEGDVNFDYVLFGDGNVSFYNTSFGKGDVSFERLDFKGLANFSNLQNVSVVKSFSFAHSIFQSSLEISSDEPFGCVIDLTSTKMSNQVSLEGLECNLKKTKSLWGSEWLGKARARDVEDIARLRRLKEIAGNNKDHEQALNFNVMEMQAKRWHQTTIADLYFEFIFQKASNYGRSEFRAFLWLVFLCVACSRAYLCWSDTVKDYLCEPSGKMWASATFSIGQMLPFVPASGAARIGGAKCLFQFEQLPAEVILLAFAQSVISIILIFLIGLSLRNRFKV